MEFIVYCHGSRGLPAKIRLIGLAPSLYLHVQHPKQWCPLTVFYPQARPSPRGSIVPLSLILAANVLQQMTGAIPTATPTCLSNTIQQSVITFQYANDTLLLLSAQPTTIKILLVVIHCFSASSGLTVNLNKNSFVPLSISSHHLQTIEVLLGCKRQDLPIPYLGMPLSVRAPRREDFMPLLTKLKNRLDG